MLSDQTRAHITSLSDADLLEYNLMGPRVYLPEALALAKQELARRPMPQQEVDILRPQILQKISQMNLDALPDPSKRAGRDSIVCQRCGLEAPTRFVEYHQNIGAIMLRFHKAYRGAFCRKCNHHYFRTATFITLFLGWWGVISFLSSAIFLVNNILMFGRSFSIPRVPPGARRPALNDAVIEKIAPHIDAITTGLVAANEPMYLCRRIAADAGLTPGEVLCFVRTMIQNQAAPSPAAAQ